MLDRLYLAFDELARKHEVFKVETIGDAWMGVTNLEGNQKDTHVKQIAQFAVDAVDAASKVLIDRDDPSAGFVHIRAGFHCGEVVSNVIGSLNPRYGLFGDTVNTASRMESPRLSGKETRESVREGSVVGFHEEPNLAPRTPSRINMDGSVEPAIPQRKGYLRQRSRSVDRLSSQDSPEKAHLRRGRVHGRQLSPEGKDQYFEEDRKGVGQFYLLMTSDRTIDPTRVTLHVSHGFANLGCPARVVATLVGLSASVHAHRLWERDQIDKATRSAEVNVQGAQQRLYKAISNRDLELMAEVILKSWKTHFSKVAGAHWMKNSEILMLDICGPTAICHCTEQMERNNRPLLFEALNIYKWEEMEWKLSFRMASSLN
eukprot:scaffold3779_cov80-Cylindrotheca_fusiformis.AAC.1